MSIKLQINSLDAIERLIGGDSELEIEVRASVVEAFMKKHINSIVNSKVTEAVKRDILSELIIPAKGYNSYDALTVKTKELLKAEIDGQFRKIANDALNAYLAEGGLDQLMKEKAAYVADTLTARTIDVKFDQYVDIAIKKKLGFK